MTEQEAYTVIPDGKGGILHTTEDRSIVDIAAGPAFPQMPEFDAKDLPPTTPVPESQGPAGRQYVLPIQARKAPVKTAPNAPCPCGKQNPNTGKTFKYKKCCMSTDVLG